MLLLSHSYRDPFKSSECFNLSFCQNGGILSELDLFNLWTAELTATILDFSHIEVSHEAKCLRRIMYQRNSLSKMKLCNMAVMKRKKEIRTKNETEIAEINLETSLQSIEWERAIIWTGSMEIAVRGILIYAFGSVARSQSQSSSAEKKNAHTQAHKIEKRGRKQKRKSSTRSKCKAIVCTWMGALSIALE